MAVDWERARREREEREARAQARARAGAQIERKLALGLGALLGAVLAGLAATQHDHPLWLRAAVQLGGVGLAVLLVYAVEKTTGAPVSELPRPYQLLVDGLALALFVGPALALLAWALFVL